MTMAKKRREIPEKQPEPSVLQQVFPMQLKLGESTHRRKRRVRIIGRPYVTTGGKDVHVRVQRVDNPDASA
jgi:hypothetical protein